MADTNNGFITISEHITTPVSDSTPKKIPVPAKKAVIFVSEPQTNPNIPHYGPANSWDKATDYASKIDALEKSPNCKPLVFKVNRVSQMKKILRSIKNIELLYYIGHSGWMKLHIGATDTEDTNISEYGDKNDVSSYTLDWSNLRPQAKIYIWGCNAGRYGNKDDKSGIPIAQIIANASGKLVTAPSVYLNFDEADGMPFIRQIAGPRDVRTYEHGEWREFLPLSPEMMNLFYSI